MHDFDVPDLVGALAERFEECDISHREAAHITFEMLADAMAANDEEWEARIEMISKGEANATAVRSKIRSKLSH